MTPEEFESLKPHPEAERFPMLNDQEHALLRDSIQDIGLRERIVIDEDTMQILDGRNRHKAVIELGLHKDDKISRRLGNKIYVNRTQIGLNTEEEISKYIFDVNAKRRHLTAGQKAASKLHLLPQLEKESEEESHIIFSKA